MTGSRRLGLAVFAAAVCAAFVPGRAYAVFWTETTLLSGLADVENFGQSVAVSGDTAIVGGRGPDNGYAYVFVRRGSGWSLQARLAPRDGGSAFGDGFGAAVALQGDTALVHRSGTSSTPGAVYVFVREGTVWSEQQKLERDSAPTSGPHGVHFGEALAVDGDTIVIGDTDDAEASPDRPGAAYVFVRAGTSWTLQQKLYPSVVGAGYDFGSSVGLQGDTILVGAYGDAEAGETAGAAYAFRREGTQWTEQQRFRPDDIGPRDSFGYRLAFSGNSAAIFADGAIYVYARAADGFRMQQKLTDPADSARFADAFAFDGDTLIIADFYQKGRALVYGRGGGVWTLEQELELSPTNFAGVAVGLSEGTAVFGLLSAIPGGPGAVRVIVQVGSSWSEQQTLTLRDAKRNERFGIAVGMAADVAVVGAAGDPGNVGIPAVSGAYAYLRDGASWGAPLALVAADAVKGDRYGEAVAAHGDTVLVGAGSEASGRGAVYAFARAGSAFAAPQKFVAADGAAGDLFGDAVAVDGDLAIVGAVGAGTASGAGAAYVFVRSGGSWSEQQKLVAADAADSDLFGIAVGVSGDLAVVGASGANAKGADSGAAYLFLRSGGSWAPAGKLVASDGAANHGFGTSVAISGDTVLVGAPGPGSGGSRAGAAYVFVRAAAVEERQKLAPSAGAANDDFGGAVALSGDMAVVGASGAADGGANAGAAYLFARSGGTFVEQRVVRTSDRRANDELGRAVAVSGSAFAIGVPFARTSGEVHVYAGFDATLADGDPCSAREQCASGYCVAGLCCDRECDAAGCEACSAAAKASAADDGACGPAASGMRCGASPRTCVTDSAYALAPLCDQAGQCAPRESACSDGLSCQRDADYGQCLPACRDDGTCPQPIGHACADDVECAGGRCAAGVCSDADPCAAISCASGMCVAGVCMEDCGDDCPAAGAGGSGTGGSGAGGSGARGSSGAACVGVSCEQRDGGATSLGGDAGEVGGSGASDHDGDDGCGCRVLRAHGSPPWLLLAWTGLLLLSALRRRRPCRSDDASANAR